MDAPIHPFRELFDQLGLPSSDLEIRSFIERHRPLPGDVGVTEAAFWTASQAALLKEMLQQDADWAPVVDRLNVALH